MGAVRGFDYQLWQSVDLWTALGPTEALFLEAAEDVDLRAEDRVEAGQVKTLARPLTLRSEAVQSALRNFWDLRARNPDLRASFVLLTTAQRGVEAGSPFGEMPGLDKWDQCRFEGADLDALRVFLGTLDLGASLGEFLTTASDSEVRDLLLRQVRWATGEPDRHGLRDRVERRVVLHGDRIGLPPSQSRVAVDSLQARAWETLVADGPRRLDRVDFLDAFEQATSVLTARSVLATTATTGGLAARAERVLDSNVRVLVQAPVPREAVVDDIRRRLPDVSVLALTGASGLGKSTLAALVAGAGGNWVRLDLRGQSEDDAADHLALAALAVADLPLATSVVIDDLPAAMNGRIELPLIHLVHAVVDRGGRALVTAHARLPSALLAATAQNDADAHLDVPPLSTHELRTLCLGAGCPPERAEQWARVIEIQTSGHPQLAAAHARSAAEKGWGTVSDDDLFGTPPTIERVKRDARRRLVTTLAGLGASDVAYRLSLYATPFTRAQALRLAAAPPSLPGAGDALDVLTGPWIEQVDESHFRVSPLLSKSYETQFDPDTVKRLHHAAALSFLEPVLDARAFSGLLLHGMAGECEKALVAAFHSVSDLEDEQFGLLAEWVSWFAHAATDEFNPLYRPDPILGILLRQLQLRVAAALGKQDAAVLVARAALREIDDVSVDGAPSIPETLRYAFASLVVTKIDADEHLPFVLEQAATAARISASGALGQMEAAAADAGLAPPPFDEELGVESLGGLIGPLVRLLTVRVRSASLLVQFLDAVEADSVLEQALSPLFREDGPATTAISDGAWLDKFRAERSGEEVDFSPAVQVLQRTIVFADERGYDALATSARRSLATVLNEHVHDRSAALAVLAAGGDRAELLDYRAKMHALDKDYSAALDLYRRLLPAWASQPARMNSARARAYHDAIRAAGEMGEFGEAAELAARGTEVAAQELARIQAPLWIGYSADHAYALYRAGRLAETVHAFEQTLLALDDAPEQQGFGVLRGRVGHVLVIIEHELTGRPTPDGFSDPFVGLFSKPEPDFEDFEAPASPAMIWGRLAHIESLVGSSRSVSQRYLALSTGVTDRLVVYDRAQHRASLAILDGHPDLMEVLSDAYRCAALGAGRDPGTITPFDLDLAQSALTSAWIRAAADGALSELPIDTWVASACAMLDDDPQARAEMERWRETATLAVSLESGTRRAAAPLHRQLIDEGQGLSVRATAAAVLALYAEDPDTQFYARATVLQVAEQRMFSDVLERHVSRLVTGNPGAGYAGAARAILATDSRISISEEARPYFERVAAGISSRA
ncbi:hypothetical protein BSZ36_18245 [Rubricoccus marinus]|uniref:Uncharacterized protein n=2 Tax=Rubricoccus marinus TaxID=716817 RepID=A0A259TUG4_9BACT|nr:hypothetical protein BSZ36_18245 [Rubricoccus marinus]